MLFAFYITAAIDEFDSLHFEIIIAAVIPFTMVLCALIFIRKENERLVPHAYIEREQLLSQLPGDVRAVLSDMQK